MFAKSQGTVVDASDTLADGIVDDGSARQVETHRI
jgi:hypothetical protein